MFRLRVLDAKSSEMLGNQEKVNKGNSNTKSDHTPPVAEVASNLNHLSQGKGHTWIFWFFPKKKSKTNDKDSMIF